MKIVELRLRHVPLHFDCRGRHIPLRWLAVLSPNCEKVHSMSETRDAREKELTAIGAANCIQLIRLYQIAIGTPNGQISIPGVPQPRMIAAIHKKEFPAPIA